MKKQLLLPGLPLLNPEVKKAKINPDLQTKKGKSRTPKGIERRLKQLAPITEEESNLLESYEETGIDNTDGETYWSAFRGR